MPFMLLGLIAFSVTAVCAQERAWGFDKDTVYEWSPGGDTTLITNTGSTILRFDSLIVERLGGKEWGNLSFEQLSTDSQKARHTFLENVTESKTFPSVEVAPGQSISFMNFSITTFATTAKVSQTNFTVGDTTRARLRIVTSSSDEDTVVIQGVYDIVSSIRYKSRLDINTSPNGPSYDALGRRKQIDAPFRAPASTPHIPK